MPKTYLGSTLQPNEWLVLSCLVCAEQEGETPCNWLWLSSEYELLQDVTEPIEEVLDRLHSLGLAGQDLGTTLWLPTPFGRGVVEFSEKTAVVTEE